MAYKLTKSFVDSVPLSLSKQAFYRDSELKGFALRVGSTGKVYIAESKAKGKVVRVERRQSVIKAHALASWYIAVMNIKNDIHGKNRETIRDYLLLVIFTGLRRDEAARLTWENVDLHGKTLTVTDTKNRQDHTLPLSDFLFDLLKRRQAEAVNEYVFPGANGVGRIVELRKQTDKVILESGVKFTIHDLRRTFITIAESLDISAYSLKRLLNHKMTNDVTAGYIITDVERLRIPMQKITDHLLKCMGVKPSAEIVGLKSYAQQPAYQSGDQLLFISELR